MKQPFLYTLLMMLLFFTGIPSTRAQNVLSILDKTVSLTWLGIDFSHARYSGNTGDESAGMMVDYFPKINKLILDEPIRYDLKKTFHKESVTPQLEMVTRLNTLVDTNQLITTKSVDYYRITKEKISLHVKNYDTGNLKGLGVIIIIEDLNKTWEKASMWVTYFDIETKTVLLTEKLLGAASGLGFRNHWTAPINEVMNLIQHNEYKRWKKKLTTKNQ